MIKSIKYELSPTNSQKQKLNQTFGNCRFVYNWALDKKIKSYQNNKQRLSCFDLIKELTYFKKDGGFDWGETPEGERFWVAVLGYKHFERFFELYAENKVVSQPPFKPFEKVLVRNGENSKWKIDFFSHIDKEESFKFICLSNQYKYCVPFRGNEHLLNTNANVESQ